MEQHIESVLHLKKKLDKGVSFEKTMHILYKLQKIPISIKLLEETGIGFKVRELGKQQKNNDIGKTAKLLTMAWKDFVRNKQYQQENMGEDEESEVEHESPNQSSDNNNSWDTARNINNNNNGSPSAYSSPKDVRNSNSYSREYYSTTNGGTNNNNSNFDEDNSEVTPRSERSEESVNNSASSHKKKHKKKKKKSKEEDHDSDDDNDDGGGGGGGRSTSREKDKKKEKKKRYRDNNDSDDGHKHRRTLPELSAPSSSSTKPSTEINCDKMYDSKFDSKKPKIKEIEEASSSSTNNNKYSSQSNQNSHKSASASQECDIFGTLLGMNDQITNKSGSTARKAMPVPVITRASKPSSSSHHHSAKPAPPNGNQTEYSTSHHHSSSKFNQSSSPVKMTNQSSQNDRFDILKSLPDPNYRPPPVQRRDDYMYQEVNRQPQPPPPIKNDLNALLLAGIKMKGRSAVYAGSSKLTTVSEVFPLHDLCLRVLMNHIDRIYEVGDLPYYILKPVLTKCSVSQLRRIENYNPQLLEESDELWHEFCNKEFKNRHIDDSNYFTWREFHEHLMNEREEKLKNITRNISSKQRKAVPERKTQQIDLKTPREVRRRQERTGAPFSSYSSSRGGGGGGGGGGGAGGSRSHGSSSYGSSGSAVTIVNSKPKTAPLMKKLLQFRKGKFNRK